MGRSKTQHGTLYKVKSKRSGLESWWGRYRMYNSRGVGVEQRTCLGLVDEVPEKQARLALVDLIRRMNQRAQSIHHIDPVEVLKREIEYVGKPSRCANGTISELVVAADLMARGYEVFRALSPQASCDLIAIKNGEFQKIEVKTRSVAFSHGLRRNLGNFDLAAIFSPETGKIEYLSAFELKLPKSKKNSGNFAAGADSQDIDSTST